MTIRVRPEAGHAVLEVRDEGAGLSDADAARAFDRFWRSDHGRQGSGLGLAIVRAVAERHGGTAGVHGSAFTLRVPLSERSQDPPVEPGRPHPSRQEIA